MKKLFSLLIAICMICGCILCSGCGSPELAGTHIVDIVVKDYGTIISSPHTHSQGKPFSDTELLYSNTEYFIDKKHSLPYSKDKGGGRMEGVKSEYLGKHKKFRIDSKRLAVTFLLLAFVVAISFPSEIQRIIRALSESIVIVSLSSSTTIELITGLMPVE